MPSIVVINTPQRGYWMSEFGCGDHDYAAKRCLDCGEWLPLGHSDETPERVALEIRAAEIAWGGPLGVSETIGWFHCIGGRDWDESADAQWKAGYLARVIADHKETP